MSSLLQKLSFFDPETGDTFVVASDGFYWKEGKKAPEDSKVTHLLKQYGWNLQHGTDAFLIFKQKGNSGDLFVVRGGNKRWSYELRNKEGELYLVGMKGKGLDSLRDALDNGVLNDSLAKVGGAAATAVNNAGNGHSEVDDGFSLLERRILGYDATDDDLGPAFWPEGERKLTPEQEKSNADSHTRLEEKLDRVKKHLIEQSKGVLSSLTDGACLVLSGSIKTASSTKQADMYVTSVKYEQGSALKLASFKFSPDLGEAMVFLPRTAANLSRQILGICGQAAKIVSIG